MEAVKSIWTPEQPENQHLKMQCLQEAASVYRATGKNDGDAILSLAKQMYEWVSMKKK